MSAEENKAIARRDFEEVWNQGNLSAIDEIYTTDYIRHDAVIGDTQGPEGVKQVVTMYYTAFPDLHLTIEDIIAEGDKVAYRWTGSGTHKGELMGIAPTGKHGTMTGINIFRIASGKIVEGWISSDALGMLQQLGVIPPM
jgi:steroid delta-isomerase-like uncharacterized protein